MDHAPEWVRIIGQLQPFHYLVKAMGIAVNPEDQPSSIWMPLSILAGFTLIGLLLAALTFRWDNDAPSGRKKQHRVQEASSV